MNNLPTQPGLQLLQVSKSFGKQQVLKNVNLTAWPGRIYGILGPNGAGKSTTFNLALGLIKPDHGQVNILGNPFCKAALAHIGATINGPAFYPQLSATQNLKIHCLLTGTSTSVIPQLLATVGLAQAGRKRAGNFSTGMKVRLALAMALVGNPEILILDEPQNGLDPTGIIWLREFLKQLASQGKTIIVSSHVLGEISRMCDDIGILVQGQLVYSGSMQDLAPAGDEAALEAAYLNLVAEVAP